MRDNKVVGTGMGGTQVTKEEWGHLSWIGALLERRYIIDMDNGSGGGWIAYCCTRFPSGK
jgi:hypothetical protein